MAISTERFEFALDNLASSQWAQFEKLAGVYFATEWPSYRTVAAASGDLGRDGELFTPNGDPTVVLQFSVAKDWAAKILLTIKRIKEEKLEPTVLVYATNRRIGAAGDDYKAKCLESGFRLDIRDRSYFLERLHTTQARQEIAGEFAAAVADPILGGIGMNAKNASGLGASESKVALVFIAMQLEDDKRDKGLTKISYEALVRSVMQGTNADNRIDRQEIVEKVAALLPAHAIAKVENHITGALDRLCERGIIKIKDKTYSLSFEEQEKIKDYTARTLLREAAFSTEVKSVCEDIGIPSQKFDRIIDFVKRVLGVLSFKKGEGFAQAVAKNDPDISTDAYDIPDAMLSEISSGKDKFTAEEIDGISIAIRRLVDTPRAETEIHTLGYSSWWLTLDRHARNMIAKVKLLDGMRNVGQPVMSIDFLLKYLELGPSRHLIKSENEVSLPPFISIASTMENYTEELLATADSIRKESAALDEVVVRRRIRDGLDQIRIKYGDMHENGIEAVKRAAAQSKN